MMAYSRFVSAAKGLGLCLVVPVLLAACSTPAVTDGSTDSGRTDVTADTRMDTAPPTDTVGTDTRPDTTPPTDTVLTDTVVTDTVLTDVVVTDTVLTDVVIPIDAMCPSGQLLCVASCVYPDTDNNNCGTCGHVCLSTETCTAGTCAPTVACPAPRTMCGAACVNTATDVANCGACGTACTGTDTCTAGVCTPVVTCTAPRITCGGACIDPTTDTLNCGACGTVCPSGATCTGGACACAAGQMVCGPTGSRACVNTQTDSANCGTCGVTCATGQTCVAGACQLSCTLPETRCTAGGVQTCRNLQTDTTNCGTCGNACPSGQLCNAGVCGITCPTGQSPCTAGGVMTCRNLQTDPMNCGTCGTACTPGQACMAGACVAVAAPANDNCATAAPVVLSAAGTTTTVTGTLVGATDSPGSCYAGGVGSGGDVFFAFTLSAREVVYIDTFGSTPDTVIGFVNGACGTAATSCNDDSSCGGLQSQTTAVLAAGTYRIVVDVYGARASGPFTLHIQHYPVGNGPVVAITPTTTMANATGTTAGTGTIGGSCGGAGSPENTYYFTTCPTATAQLFHATTCGGATWDTLIYQQSNGRAGDVCNDDQGYVCGARSSVTSQIPAGANLHTITVDGFGTGSAGAYTLQYRYVSCTAGFTNCTGTCIETARMQTDNANCGACGTVCAAGTLCATGVCRPANDNRANATTLTLTPGEVTVTGNTTLATQDGSTVCSSAPNVWYRVVLAAREVLYADTAGSGYDTKLAIFDSAGAQVTAATGEVTCSDDAGCTTGGFTATNQSQVAAVLNPGTYYLNVAGFSAAAGAFTLHVQHLAANIGSYFYATPITGTAQTATTSLVGTSVYTPACTLGTSGEDVRWFTACGASATASLFSLCQSDMGTFTRQIGTTTYDPSMAVRGGLTGAEIACNDDGTGTTNCQGTGGDTLTYGSRISVTLPRGISAVVVDERTQAAGMQYRLAHVINR